MSRLAAAMAVGRLEALALLRTRETWSMGLLPATLFVPLTLLGTSVLASAGSPPTLAIPESDPPFLTSFESEAFQIVRDPAPDVRWAAGEVDVAVVSWTVFDLPQRSLTASALWHDDGAAALLRAELDRWADAEVDAQVRAAGGQAADRVVAEVATPSVVDFRQALWFYFSILGGLAGSLTIPVRAAIDRQRGGLEALAVTPTALGDVFAARVMVGAAFATCIAAVPLVSTALVAGSVVGFRWRAVDLVEAMSLHCLLSVVYVGAGVVANSSRLALQLASTGMLAIAGAGAVALPLDLPTLPLLGLFEEGPSAQALYRAAALVMMAGGLWAVLGRVVRQDAVLPTGGGE